MYENINPALLNTRQYDIGIYGRKRLDFLKEQHPDVYTTLIFTGELGQHLVEVNTSCCDRICSLIAEMAQREGVTEQLKGADQLEWVRRMNNIKHRAEEIVQHDMICAL